MNEPIGFETVIVRRTLEGMGKRNTDGAFFIEFGENLALAIPRDKTTNFDGLIDYLDSLEDRFKNDSEVWIKFCRLYMSVIRQKRQWEAHSCNRM